MISVLVPSRGRAQALLESLESLRATAIGDGLQFVVGLDPDDAHRYPALGDVATVWTAPERYGYVNLHRYYNELARRALGDWLLLWNDDALMTTAGWDQIVEAQEPGVLWPAANHHAELNLFPIWPSAWTRAMGHVSLCFNCDSWLMDVGQLLGRQWKVPIEIFHDRDNQTGSGKFADETAEEGTLRSDQTCSTLTSPEMVAARVADAARVRDLL